MPHEFLTAPDTPFDAALRLTVAGLIGLAVGIERQWSGHASGPEARFAGMRTFLIIGITSGTAGLLSSAGQTALATVLLLGVAASAVAAFVVTNMRTGVELDGTTEAAALAVAGLGTLAGGGQLALTAGAVAVMVFALGEKERLHSLVSRVGRAELQAAARFAVMALVILPLLPSSPISWLGDLSLRAIWALVLAFSAINFLGYLAIKVVGPDRGYGIAGLLGGMLSSTAVVLQFSRQSKAEPEHSTALARGAVASCAVVPVRLLAVTAVLAPSVALEALRYLVAPTVVGFGILATGLVKPEVAGRREAEASSPLKLGSSIRLALFLAVTLAIVEWVAQASGSGGILATAALLGLTNTDPVTVSMARHGAAEGQVALAAQGIAVALLANTSFKLAMALATGGQGYRRLAATGMGLMAAAVGAGFL